MVRGAEVNPGKSHYPLLIFLFKASSHEAKTKAKTRQMIWKLGRSPPHCVLYWTLRVVNHADENWSLRDNLSKHIFPKAMSALTSFNPQESGRNASEAHAIFLQILQFLCAGALTDQLESLVQRRRLDPSAQLSTRVIAWLTIRCRCSQDCWRGEIHWVRYVWVCSVQFLQFFNDSLWLNFTIFPPVIVVYWFHNWHGLSCVDFSHIKHLKLTLKRASQWAKISTKPFRFNLTALFWLGIWSVFYVRKTEMCLKYALF